MELIIIDNSRIKLMLTREDMAAYSEQMTPEVFRSIINDAREKCGYNGGMNGRIYIQMYPSREGGCELFVTKLDERKNRTHMKTINEGIQSEYRKYIFRGRVIYAFDSMPHLLYTCRDLYSLGYSAASSAYLDESERIYYLVLECETHIAGENLGRLCRSSSFYYINEHCKRFSSDAVGSLSNLA